MGRADDRARLNSGVADAENAAWKIAYAGRGSAPQALLASYHDERHAAARENVAVTTATPDFLVPPDETRARRRAEVLARAATDPAARARVDSGRLAEPFWYVDSPLTTADPRRPSAGRPPRGQTPPSQCHGGWSARARQISAPVWQRGR